MHEGREGFLLMDVLGTVLPNLRPATFGHQRTCTAPPSFSFGTSTRFHVLHSAGHMFYSTILLPEVFWQRRGGLLCKLHGFSGTHVMFVLHAFSTEE